MEYTTTIRVRRDTVARLKEWGEFGESRDDVINKILDMVNGRVKKKKDT